MTCKIEAIIREEMVGEIKDALREIGIVGMNFHEVAGHGRQGGIQLAGRSGTYVVDLLPKMQLNIVLSDQNVSRVVETIRRAACTGEEGDGMIFVLPVQEVIRIRTGERDGDALSYQDDIDVRSWA